MTRSLSLVRARPCVFVAPAGLDLAYYRERWPWASVARFNDADFESVASYSRLLLEDRFYACFRDYEYLLVLQPDAILFRDDLDAWICAGFDYVGAPWPDPIEITLWRDDFVGARRRRIQANVGNGGLSLRRIAACRELLAAFPETLSAFRESGTNEDAYFSLLGTQLPSFKLPTDLTASRFSMELSPQDYFARNGGVVPMGSHGWASFATHFWAGLSLIPDPAGT